MVVGERLRLLREAKKLSQGDIQERTGLLRCYISRVENGHTVPALDTIEKISRALEIPLYQLFYEGEKPPAELELPRGSSHTEWGSKGKEARMLLRFRRLLGKLDERDRSLLLFMAQELSRRSGKLSKLNAAG